MSIVDSTREKVGRLIKMYEKSHNYHNFTSGKYVTIVFQHNVKCGNFDG